MSLPTLPTPDTHCFDDDTGISCWSHSPTQLKEYGQACREAALEEAAQVCSHKAETKRLYLNESHYLECAEAIRSLK